MKTKSLVQFPFLSLILLFVLIFSSCINKENFSSTTIQVWTTTADKTLLFNSQQPISFGSDSTKVPTIDIDTTQKFQQVDGFGYTLTGGSAMLINKLNAGARDSLLRELFLPDGNGIGISYLRISIGASDLDDHVFSYNDLKAGEKDLVLKKFSLDEDRKHLIPVLKQILSINPQLKIMGSPWSAPAWMKSNGNAKGGSLKKEFYGTYAQYFMKYIQGMAEEGILMDAITIQNEPENPNNTPSMLMTALEQADFIKNHLGPAFKQAGISTKIILFDHNCDNPNYPISILNNDSARQFVDGSAFHMYLGEIKALGEVHDAHPDKNIYFTEQWTAGDGDFGGDLKWHVENLIIGAMRNWSRTVLEWNLAADPQFNPHTPDGGCDKCLGALTIGETVTRNVSYYIIAHASKFVRPGSVRIGSTEINDLPNVVFINPIGQKICIVLNTKNKTQNFQIKFNGQFSNLALLPGAVSTFVWD
jgi:glucosylceramidase